MAFEGLKKKFSEFKEDIQFKREVSQDQKRADEFLRSKAREQAKQDFLERRQELLQEREQAFLEQERKKYESQEAQLQDTRTGGQKFKEGLQKLGSKAQQVGARIGTDTIQVGRDIGQPNIQQFDTTVQQGLTQPPQQTTSQNVFFGRSEQNAIAKDNMRFQKQQFAQKFNKPNGPSFMDKLKSGQTNTFNSDKLKRFLK